MSRTIPLTQGQTAIVDDGDYDWLTGYRWYANRDGRRYYANRSKNIGGKKKMISMARMIMEAPPDTQVDHKDGNPLNNQRSNLRICSRTENNWNSVAHIDSNCRLVGVSWDASTGRYAAEIQHQHQKYRLGLFDDEVSAARVRDAAAFVLRGEYACLNFLLDYELVKRVGDAFVQGLVPRRPASRK